MAITEGASGSSEPINLVMFGKVGNGKSSTANCILGRKACKSMIGAAGITTECQLETTTLDDGQVVNVIDTPGIFDPKENWEDLRKEIVRCVEMSKHGIHGLLLVFSIRNRFSEEEEGAIGILQEFFGESIIKYMVVVFTGGDELDDDQTFSDYLSDCPASFTDLVELCKGRVVVFDNRTKDKNIQKEQVTQLINIVKTTLVKCDGKAYTNEIFEEMKKQTKLKPTGKEKDYESMQKNYEEQIRKITESIELKLNESTMRYHEELQRERAAREKAENEAKESRRIADENARRMIDEMVGLVKRNTEADERREKERRDREQREHERRDRERAEHERRELERGEMIQKMYALTAEKNASDSRVGEERMHRERVERMVQREGPRNQIVIPLPLPNCTIS